MDRNEALDIMEAVRNKVPEADRSALDEEYASRFIETASNAGSLALEGAQSEETATVAPEAPTITSESLLATLDTAITTYSSQLDVVNGERAKAKGRKKPEQLEAVDQSVIRAEVEALVSNPAILADLQAEADYFTANPETGSPAVGFDIVVIPEGLTASDDQAIAGDVQAKITTDYSPYVRPEAYNDKRTPAVTDKGFRVAVVPRHYNVPKGTTSNQTSWMKTKNQSTTATQLQTATDAEALAQINNLVEAGELNDPNTRFDKSYFRRFDQTPYDDNVSCVCVVGDGWLLLDKSFVDNVYSTRALVVPKLNT